MKKSTLGKYTRLFFAFARASFVADLEYRMNFATRIVTDVFWYLAQIVTFEALYRHTETLGGWHLAETRVFLGLLFVVDSLFMILFSDNIDRMSERVRKGEMDLLLAKPVNSQFMMSCQRLATALSGNFLIALSWLIWSILHLPGFQWVRIFWLIPLIPCGLFSFYAVKFMIASTSLMFTRSENLQYLWYQLYRLGMRPDTLYPLWLKYTILTILPMGLIASVPAHFILETPQYELLVITLLVTSFFVWLSTRFWKYALSQYSSASS